MNTFRPVMRLLFAGARINSQSRLSSGRLLLCSQKNSAAAIGRSFSSSAIEPNDEHIHDAEVVDDIPDNSDHMKRLTQLIADTGLVSRREAERLVKEGRVCVAGQVATSPAVKIDLTDSPLVEIDGVPLRQQYDLVYPRVWAVLKLKQEIVSSVDQKSRSLLLDRIRTSVLPEVFHKYGTLKPVYRLDYITEGLCLLTNQGEMARLMETQMQLTKHYRVRIHGMLTESKLAGLRRGLVVDGKKIGGMKVEVQHKSNTITWLKMSTTEKQSCKAIHKSLQQLYLQVTRLICVGYGPYHMEDCFPEKSSHKVKELRIDPSIHAQYHRLQNSKSVRKTSVLRPSAADK